MRLFACSSKPALRLGLAILLSAFAVMASVPAQQIAITFDDLPSHGSKPIGETRLEIANSILATLHADHMPPTYGFVNGDKVAADPATIAVLKAWRAAGNPLGSHTWSHMNFNDHTPAEFEADIAKNEPLLESLMGDQDWHWFRYPFLWEGDTLDKRHAVRAYLFAHGYRIAQVNMDFEDYLWNDPYARCIAKHDDKSIEYLGACGRTRKGLWVNRWIHASRQLGKGGRCGLGELAAMGRPHAAAAEKLCADMS
jgi:peptidoglycan/xylan/chitin deacetylase (PgdA/CDA1 family)